MKSAAADKNNNKLKIFQKVTNIGKGDTKVTNSPTLRDPNHKKDNRPFHQAPTAPYSPKNLNTQP